MIVQVAAMRDFIRKLLRYPAFLDNDFGLGEFAVMLGAVVYSVNTSFQGLASSCKNTAELNYGLMLTSNVRNTFSSV